jgi:hypothetical protein
MSLATGPPETLNIVYFVPSLGNLYNMLNASVRPKHVAGEALTGVQKVTR